jgi:hypothetical protein
MNTVFSIVLLVAGIGMLILGFSSMDSVSSHFSRFFTGHPTDKSMWLIIGGSTATVIGLFGGILRRSP